MLRKTSAKTDGQAQGATDNTTHSSANSREKPEEQSSGIRNVPSNGRWEVTPKTKTLREFQYLILLE
eukprot:14029070-Ditylum_brightwellii.AAC.1